MSVISAISKGDDHQCNQIRFVGPAMVLLKPAKFASHSKPENGHSGRHRPRLGSGFTLLVTDESVVSGSIRKRALAVKSAIFLNAI